MLTIAFALAAQPVYQQPLGYAPTVAIDDADHDHRQFVYRFGNEFIVLDADRAVVAQIPVAPGTKALERPGWSSWPANPGHPDHVAEYPSIADVPPVVRTRDRNTVLFHDASGLWLWPLHGEPRQLHTRPVTHWQDLDRQHGWTLPAEDPATGAIASVSEDVLYWHAPDGTLLEQWPLPATPGVSAWWQVFAGPDGRVAITGHRQQGRGLWFRVDGEWRRSAGRVFNYIRQTGEWHQADDGSHRLLISDGKHGATLLDDTGAVLATRKPVALWRIYSRAVFSPDRERLAHIMDAPDEHDPGIYILDAEDLSVLERHPLPTLFGDSEHGLAWQEDGLWATPSHGLTSGMNWSRWDRDPLEAAIFPGRNHFHGRVQVDGRGVVYALVDGRSQLADRFGGELGPVVHIDASGWSVQQPDGSLRCGGTGCLRWRCVDDGVVGPLEDRACRDVVSIVSDPQQAAAPTRGRRRRR